MKFIVVSLVALLGGLLFFFSRRANAMEEAPTMKNDFDILFQEIGTLRGVDPDLLTAIAIAESNLKSDAIRNNPPHDVSVGLMQVLCIPDAKGNCKNRFDVEGWNGMTFDRLKDARTNIDIAAQIIAWNISTYGMPRAIAVYNAWSQRKAPINGPFTNNAYVKKVYKNLAKIKGQT